MSNIGGKGFLSCGELEEVLLDIECMMSNRYSVLTWDTSSVGRRSRKVTWEYKSQRKIGIYSPRKCWLKEYLHSLEECVKTAIEWKNTPSAGTMVLWNCNTRNKTCWRTERIQEMITEKMGLFKVLQYGSEMVMFLSDLVSWYVI